MKYLLRVLLAFDQLMNAILGGYPDETISYRASIDAAEGKFFGCMFCKLVEVFLPGHCNLRQPSKSERLARGWISETQWYINHNK